MIKDRKIFLLRKTISSSVVVFVYLDLNDYEIAVKPNTNESQNNKQTHQIHTGIDESFDRGYSFVQTQKKPREGERESEIKSTHSVEFDR